MGRRAEQKRGRSRGRKESPPRGRRQARSNSRARGRSQSRDRGGRGQTPKPRSRSRNSGDLRGTVGRGRADFLRTQSALHERPRGYVSGNVSILPSSAIEDRVILYRSEVKSTTKNSFVSSNIGSGKWGEKVFSKTDHVGFKVISCTITCDPGYWPDCKGTIAVVGGDSSAAWLQINDHAKVMAHHASRVWSWPQAAFSTTIDMVDWHKETVDKWSEQITWLVSTAVQVARLPKDVDGDVILTISHKWLIRGPRNI